MKQVEFKAPENAVPDQTQVGEEFDAVCTFKVKDNGQICLIKLGDTEMPGYDSKGDYKPDYEAPGDMEQS